MNSNDDRRSEVTPEMVQRHLPDVMSRFASIKRPHRDPARIERVLELIRVHWQRNPELRLSQLLVNLIRPNEPCPQVFYYEDDRLIEQLEQRINAENNS